MDRDVEIGWGISEARRRRGYALEAVLAVVEWVLGQPGTQSLSATIADDNVASQHLAAKLGLVRTSRVRRETGVVPTGHITWPGADAPWRQNSRRGAASGQALTPAPRERACAGSRLLPAVAERHRHR
jgi:RimJ/RimL family protein N-acetyltransferase